MTRLLILAAALFALAACETIEGAGRDIQNAGQTVETTAEELDG
ncbi:entericidin A/B family lipoprotein [Pseudooceanicola sp.]